MNLLQNRFWATGRGDSDQKLSAMKRLSAISGQPKAISGESRADRTNLFNPRGSMSYPPLPQCERSSHAPLHLCSPAPLPQCERSSHAPLLNNLQSHTPCFLWRQCLCIAPSLQSLISNLLFLKKQSAFSGALHKLLSSIEALSM